MSAVGDKKRALELVDTFAQNRGPHSFRRMHRSKVASGLRERIENPYKINQGNVGLCGPASVLFANALHNPLGYSGLVMDLFERGRACLRHWELRPSKALLHHDLGAHPGIEEVDWIPMASIRDCDNWFFHYTSPKNSGGTTFWELEEMFRKAGYTDVVSDNNVFFTAVEAMLREASDLRRQDYKVCLRINSALLIDKSSTWSLHSNHWVVLDSPVTDLGNGYRRLRLFTWGGHRDLKEPLDRILAHLYGYVACKL
jgi:hypothetical protein